MAYISRMLIILLVLAMLTGCWSRREVNDLIIAVAMGVDRVGEEYRVSVQVVDPGEITAKKASGRSPVTVYTEKGKTVFEAVRRMTTTSARKIYFSHLRMFLIGEETARGGIGHVIEFLSRDHEFRTDFYIAIARNMNAENILKNYTSIEKLPANKMFSSLEMSSQSWAATGTVKLDELVTDLMAEGKSPVITGIGHIGDIEEGMTKKNVEVTEPPARLKYRGMAVFRSDKLIGWLNEDESKGYNYIRGKVKSTVGVLPCPHADGNLSFEQIRMNSRIRVDRHNHPPKVSIDINVVTNIGESQCKIDLTNPNVIQKLENSAEKKVKLAIEGTLKKARQLRTDFVGLGAAIHRSAPEAWGKLKRHWPERMDSVPVNIQVHMKLKHTIKTRGTFLEKMKE
ncbi:Ger(x)C family spore germination protein [Paenibacillus thiaminolyticus]|uniref:Ger(x)C family spore germination protein n=1 Tax=Paenibacillus thiaminolyticus TaxID=49283 RepID=UPI00232F9933|nr:Ger(x)C family spore germination protein [Paenibacillus thiaminolyticus]WCF07918.1 Ger(x)C family spore germination protein [Paenibacillus thiaminolyticus]